jgi:DNA-3-methyladenine glycosylase II
MKKQRILKQFQDLSIPAQGAARSVGFGVQSPQRTKCKEYITPVYWEEAKTALSAADAILGNIIQQYQGEILEGKADAFHTLARAIVGQQISVKAADAVWLKLQNHFGNITPRKMQEATEETYRSCGLSQMKASYMADLVHFFLKRRHLERDWAEMSDAEVIADLTQIRGIGRWTAEMFLIFHLLRPDVLPLDDIGLLKAMHLHYHGTTEYKNLRKADYASMGEAWKPWRSVATWYLWRSLDPVPVAY